jgi:hypothetical protein
MTADRKAELEEPVENVMTKGFGKVVTTVKIANHRIVDINIEAQYELREDNK